MISSKPPQRRMPAPTRLHLVFVTTAFLVFILYGSFVPFHYHALSWEQAVNRFREVCSEPIRVESRSDWTANIALFIPLGFLLMACLCVDRTRWAGWIAALPVMLACSAFTTAIEFTQLFFPPRVSSVQDIAAESIGGIVGITIWLAAGPQLITWSRSLWSSMGQRGLALQLLPGYLALLVLLHLLPLDLTLSPHDIYDKYKSGSIRLVPFGARPEDGFAQAIKHLWTIIYFLPLGVLAGSLPNLRDRARKMWPRALGLALMTAGFLELLKLFVISRFVDTTNVLVGASAAFGGWLAFGRLQAPEKGSNIPTSTTPRATLRTALTGWSLIGLWSIIILYVNWNPFDFEFDSTFVESRLRAVSLMPFLDYYNGDYWHALDEFVKKSLLFAPFGFFFGMAWPRLHGRWQSLAIVALTLAIAAIIETGQLFLPSRYASVTDVLVESFGAWLGVIAWDKSRMVLPLRTRLERKNREFCG